VARPVVLVTGTGEGTVYVSRRVLRGLLHYVEIERDEVVERQRWTGAFAGAGLGRCPRGKPVGGDAGRGRLVAAVRAAERRGAARTAVGS
jgi:hypothetical protein